jgi:serine protease
LDCFQSWVYTDFNARISIAKESGLMDYKTALLGIALLSFTQGIYSAQTETELRVIVKYKTPISPSLAEKNQLSRALNLPVNAIAPIAGEAYVLVFREHDLNNWAPLTGKNTITSVLAQLRKNPNIIYAVQDRIGHFKPLPTAVLNDIAIPLSHELQWDEFKAPAGIMLESEAGLENGAWAYTTGIASLPVVVAVLDTGVALNNSLMGSLLKDSNGAVWGWNFAANNRDISDETKSYHGTHVAGTIAAFGEVMLGIGPQLKILPIKIPNKSGMFYESQVINAIYWSVGGHVPGVPINPYPAKVLNMSFALDESSKKEIEYCDQALQDTLEFARRNGAVITVAAGNDNRSEHYNAPAVCNDTIIVAATGPMGLRAHYSNYGPGVSFAAPGGDMNYGKQGGILSTVNPHGGYHGSGFDFFQGTSMASPHAAGVAGLIYAVSDGAIRPERVEQILYATTHEFGKSSNPNNSCVGTKPCGHGILDAEKAIKAALANYDAILIAPLAHELALSPCAAGGYQASVIQKDLWVAAQTTCQEKGNYEQPILEQFEDGKIAARYAKTTFLLDTSAFKQCQIIGSHGVGCYY